MDTLQVVFDRTRWQADADEDGLKWGIYVVNVAGQKTIIKGKLDPAVCQLDMCFNVVGKWVNDSKYGRQFNFQSYTRTQPNGRWGTIAFLMQAEGIGEITAGKIFDRFGENSIKVLLKSPRDMAKDLGLNPATTVAAADFLRPILGEMKVKMPLLDLFKGTRIASRTADRVIAARWNDPVARIKANPFILTEFTGIAFRQCDSLRVKLKLPATMPERIKAACEQAFHEKSDQTWLTHKQVRDTMAMLLELQTFNVEIAIDELLADGKLINSEIFGVDNLLGLTNQVKDEQEVALQLYKRLNTPGDSWPIHQLKNDDSLREHQREIVLHNMKNGGRCIVLSGSPGTGKTYCLGRILKHFGGRVAACAPTGKAAQRLTESLRGVGADVEATTIHRLLEPLPVDGGWAFQVTGENGNYIDADLVAIDESSMVNNWLAARLLRAIHPDTYVIFVGDKNQLPPVGPGTMLRDLEELAFEPLTKIERNSGKIVETCAKIRDREQFMIVPTKTPAVLDDPGNNLQLVMAAKDELKASKAIELAKKLQSRDVDWGDPIENVQFLTATHKNGHVGREALNKALQNVFNPHGKGEHKHYRVGDKIICTENVKITRNGVKTGEFIANGELGRVVESHEKRIVVKMNGTDGEFMIPCGPELGNGWDLGYCITCHKSQGSEWPLVVTVMGDDYGSGMVMCREWIYTAFSRAKDCGVVISSLAHVRNQAKKIRIWDRKSLILTHMELINATQEINKLEVVGEEATQGLEGVS